MTQIWSAGSKHHSAALKAGAPGVRLFSGVGPAKGERRQRTTADPSVHAAHRTRAPGPPAPAPPRTTASRRHFHVIAASPQGTSGFSWLRWPSAPGLPGSGPPHRSHEKSRRSGWTGTGGRALGPARRDHPARACTVAARRPLGRKRGGCAVVIRIRLGVIPVRPADPPYRGYIAVCTGDTGLGHGTPGCRGGPGSGRAGLPGIVGDTPGEVLACQQ
jgi:hypothetical protein